LTGKRRLGSRDDHCGPRHRTTGQTIDLAC
jgi:hypothetical protein